MRKNHSDRDLLLLHNRTLERLLCAAAFLTRVQTEQQAEMMLCIVGELRLAVVTVVARVLCYC